MKSRINPYKEKEGGKTGSEKKKKKKKLTRVTINVKKVAAESETVSVDII